MPTTSLTCRAPTHSTSVCSSGEGWVQVLYVVGHGAHTSNGRSARAAAETSYIAWSSGSLAGSRGSTSVICT